MERFMGGYFDVESSPSSLAVIPTEAKRSGGISLNRGTRQAEANNSSPRRKEIYLANASMCSHCVLGSPLRSK